MLRNEEEESHGLFAGELGGKSWNISQIRGYLNLVLKTERKLNRKQLEQREEKENSTQAEKATASAKT